MNAYQRQRKAQLKAIHAESQKQRHGHKSMARFGGPSGWREPTEDELQMVLNCHGNNGGVRVSDDGEVFEVLIGVSEWRYYYRERLTQRQPQNRGVATKIYAAGQTTTAVYDPQTKAPLVFKTGSKAGQIAEIKAVMNSPQWKAEHKLPEDIELNVGE